MSSNQKPRSKKKKRQKKTASVLDESESLFNENRDDNKKETANLIGETADLKASDEIEKNITIKESDLKEKDIEPKFSLLKRKRNRVKIYNKKLLDPEMQEKLENFIFKSPDEEKLANDDLASNESEENLLTELRNKNIKTEKILNAIFEILDQKGIEINLTQFGDFNVTYTSEFFKKQKDDSILKIIKNIIYKAFEDKRINPFFIRLLQNLYVRDFHLKRVLLEKFNLEPNSKTYAISNEDEIRNKEVFYILFFFFKIKKLEAKEKIKSAKLDCSNSYLTGECFQRVLYPISYVNNIRHLDFSGNKIGNIGMLYLGCGLRYNINILELDVSYNNLDNVAIFLFLIGLGYYKFFIQETKKLLVVNENTIKHSEKADDAMEIDSEDFNDKKVQNDTEKFEEINTEYTSRELKEEELLKLDENLELKELEAFKKDPANFSKHNKPSNLIYSFMSKIKKNYDFTNQVYYSENKQALKLLKLNLNNNQEISKGEPIVDLLKCCPLMKFLNLSRTGLNNEDLELVLSYLVETAVCHEPQTSIGIEATLSKDNSNFLNDKTKELTTLYPQMEIDTEDFIPTTKTNFKTISQKIIDFSREEINSNNLVEKVSECCIDEEPSTVESIDMRSKAEEEKKNETTGFDHTVICKNDFEYETNLEYLLLSHLTFNQRSLDLLGKFTSSPLCRLKVLNISEVKLKHLKTEFFFSQLEKCETLEEIYFKECDIPVIKDAKEQKAFLNFVRNCPNLKHLCVFFNNLNCEKLFYAVFEAILNRKKALKVLDYSKNHVKFCSDFANGENKLITILEELKKKSDKIEFIDISQNLSFEGDSKIDVNFKKKIATMQDQFKMIY